MITKPYAICGVCGSSVSDMDNGFCENGHDYWVESQDFETAGLEDYLQRAADNLDITLEELQIMVNAPYLK